MKRLILHVLLLAGIYAWSMAPVVSFIQQASGGASVTEICTPAGYAKVALNGVPDGGGNAPAQIKCPFCTVTAFGGAALDGPDMTAWQVLEYPPQVGLRIAARDHSPVYNHNPANAFLVRGPPAIS